ncbi:MAG TPA: c-type cytochrome [Thermoanaerobaculia bacterium]|nr:c-type cytochrome [Thermoanaerobaculia bacterium]
MRTASRNAIGQGHGFRLPVVLRSLLLTAVVVALAAAGTLACRRAPLPEVERAGRDAAAGRRIFERRCASCHNTNGDGKTTVAGRFPHANLTEGPWRSDGSLAAIERQVRFGRDPMPPFQEKLSGEQIRQVATYVLTLSRGKTVPPPGGSAAP